jgi:hypothetical protein
MFGGGGGKYLIRWTKEGGGGREGGRGCDSLLLPDGRMREALYKVASG